MKKIKFIITILFLLLILVYVSNISLIPDSIYIFEGENINLKTAFGIKTIQASNTNDQSLQNNYNLKFNLFGSITLKEVDVNVIPETYVVPVGKVIGLKLYTNGVLIVGMTEIENYNNEKVKPYENAGFQEGDTIVKINSNEIDSVQELKNIVNESNRKRIRNNIYERRNYINFTNNTCQNFKQ